MGDKCGRQVGDKCKLMRPKAPRVGDKGDKGETSVSPCGPRRDKRGRQVWETSGRQVGDMWETSVNSCGPRHPEWETRGEFTLVSPLSPTLVPWAA